MMPYCKHGHSLAPRLVLYVFLVGEQRNCFILAYTSKHVMKIKIFV
uniref:Uncharacterized protein n=1 Tax=Rhizophora mucronata TaxID=61149 RepID=A0A2P2QFH0_RHIMU